MDREWIYIYMNFFQRRREGGYAMAVGRVQPDGSGPEMQCYRCRPITNFNDITHHHLSVIATHIDLEFHPVMHDSHPSFLRNANYCLYRCI